jgi:CheY-like chemotaxis protein
VRIPAAPALVAPPSVESGGDDARRDIQRILIVDDNVDAAEMLSMFLEMSGHRTRVAYTGPEAIDVVAEFRPAIVFLDIGLPGMNGYEVAQHLRKDIPGAKLVAVTGWGTDDDKRKARAAGFDFHLTKPVETSAIEKILVELSAK